MLHIYLHVMDFHGKLIVGKYTFSSHGFVMGIWKPVSGLGFFGGPVAEANSRFQGRSRVYFWNQTVPRGGQNRSRGWGGKVFFEVIK